jgi:hypothetical protein
MHSYINVVATTALTSHPDLVVVQTCISIQRFLCENQASSFSPKAPFDLEFFYCTAASCIASAIGHSFLAELPVCKDNAAFNIPPTNSWPLHLRDSWLVKSGLAMKYVTLVCDRSKRAEFMFDLDYAIEVLARAIDEDVMESIISVKGMTYTRNDDWDYWLSGFNA